jgi:hypothetical protein
VLFVGRAQEKAGVWGTQRRRNLATGESYAWLVRSSAFINFFYCRCLVRRARDVSVRVPSPRFASALAR